MLCLAHSFVDKDESLNLIKQVVESGSISESIKEAIDLLKEKLVTDTYLRKSAQNRIIISGTNLPATASEKYHSKSYVTKQHIQHSFVVLDEKLGCIMNKAEAIEWFTVTPFSPLCNGLRINPL